VHGRGGAGRFWTPADGTHVPPVTPDRLRRIALLTGTALALVGGIAGPAGAATGGTEYGAASQNPVPSPTPAPSPGGVEPSQPIVPLPGTPVPAPQSGQVARVLPNGMAVAPAGAPAAVQQIIAAGNRIAKTKYIWGGGHRRWEDRGYDCSGSVSYALRGAALLDTPLVSGELARWGDAGPGQWVTIYANAGHVYMIVAGLRFDTSGQRKAGSRWQAARRSARGFKVRHPAGL
jgi:cell wall-associated NlpC family hydrolase